MANTRAGCGEPLIGPSAGSIFEFLSFARYFFMNIDTIISSIRLLVRTVASHITIQDRRRLRNFLLSLAINLSDGDLPPVNSASAALKSDA